MPWVRVDVFDRRDTSRKWIALLIVGVIGWGVALAGWILYAECKRASDDLREDYNDLVDKHDSLVKDYHKLSGDYYKCINEYHHLLDKYNIVMDNWRVQNILLNCLLARMDC